MTTEGFKRKLSAILSADVKGYSRLMGEDEAQTVKTITAYREVMATLIQQHRGRVIDSPGDNLLAEFASVVDAVQCAVAVQKEFHARNAELPENRRMVFRIGINLGDVIQEGERIYGDGVNIAARLESLADPGGICISKTAFDQIETKLPLGYEYLGEQTVKNIAKPVGAYRVLMEPRVTVAGEKEKAKLVPLWQRKAILTGGVAFVVLVIAAVIWNFYFRPPPIEPASVERMAFPLPEKPSIAVLPFTNMSGDPTQDYFSDGLTEQIISTLSKLRNLFVIARNSTFTYKGKPVKVQKVAEDLGVKYVLEGSVKRSADQIRITAQLIDATTGHHLWSERYDREQKDIFTIQDDLTLEITKALRIELIDGEQARIWQKHETSDLKAYEKVLQGRQYATKGTKEDGARALQLYEEAIALDPGYARAYAGLGLTHFFDARFGWVESRAESIKMAFKCAQKAIELDDTLDMAHILIGAVYIATRQYEKAIAAMERAVALNPNGADAYSTLAGALGCSGRWEESLVFGKKAIRLNPFRQVYYYHWLGRAYFMTGQYNEAILTFKKAVDANPDYLPAHAFLAACYSSLDRQAEAAAEAEEVLKINPKFSLTSYAKTLPYKNKADIERYISALRKASLPETPPLPLPDKPSIAVLPFDNLSGDPKQEYFSDGIAENIITALSKVEKLFVIARNSTFTYKGKPVKVQQVAKDLGVQYVLEGSVQRSADRIRITAQFVDARKGHHLWAERYDRDLKDIFALQDEITMKIITALEVKLTEGEQALVAGSGTDNLDAYLKILQARDLKRHQNIENNHKARRLAEEAIKLDPDYAQAYRWLSGTHLIDVWLGSTKSPRESLRTAMEHANKALSLDDSLGGAHGLLGNIYIMRKDYEKGIREAERAVELEPNGADAHAFLGMGLRFAGRPEEAIPILKKAIRLDPHAPEWYLHVLAAAYREIEKYEEATEWAEKAVQQNPKNALSRVVLCSVYSLAGRMDKARAQAEEIMRINPKFSVERFARTDPQKNQAVKKRYIDALRKAGLK